MTHRITMTMTMTIKNTLFAAALLTVLSAGAYANDFPNSFANDFALDEDRAEVSASAAHGPCDVRHPASWWDEDVWADPDRPFLYYGDNRAPDMRPGAHVERKAEKVPEKKTEAKHFDPEDFSAFKTVEALKAEREKRLNAAVMNPSPDNIRSYQAINAHMLGLSARFAQAWQLGRFMNPGYDWTTTAPSANFATVQMAENRRQQSDSLVKSLRHDAGLLFIGRAGDSLTAIAANPVRAFAKTWHLELMAVAAGINEPAAGKAVPGFEGFETVLPDGGRARTLGISTLPAVILIPNPEAMKRRSDFALMKGALAGRDGMLIAAGAVSGEELSRRLVFILSNPKGFEEAPRITGHSTNAGAETGANGSNSALDPALWNISERPPVDAASHR